MAKCLRCGAGNEWIQGKVRVEAIDDERLALYRALHQAAKGVERTRAMVVKAEQIGETYESWQLASRKHSLAIRKHQSALAALDAAGVNAKETDDD